MKASDGSLPATQFILHALSHDVPEVSPQQWQEWAGTREGNAQQLLLSLPLALVTSGHAQLKDLAEGGRLASPRPDGGLSRDPGPRFTIQALRASELLSAGGSHIAEGLDLLEYLLPCLEIADGGAGPSRRTLLIRAESARALCLQGRYREAEEAFMALLHLDIDRTPFDQPDTATLTLNLSLVFAAQGKHHEAAAWAGIAFDTLHLHLGQHEPFTLAALEWRNANAALADEKSRAPSFGKDLLSAPLPPDIIGEALARHLNKAPGSRRAPGKSYLEVMLTPPVPVSIPAKNVLEDIIGTFQNVEVGELYELAGYVRADYDHAPTADKLRLFKEQLRYAIDHPGFLTPKLYEKWTGSDDYSTQEAVQEHLEEIWDACYNPVGTKVLLKDYIEGCMNPSEPRLETLAQHCKRATGGPLLESTQFFKGELRHALDHPGFVTPALYQKWSTEPLPDQAAVQHRLQEMWDKCFGNGKWGQG